MNFSYSSASFLPSASTFDFMLSSIVTTLRIGLAAVSCNSAPTVQLLAASRLSTKAKRATAMVYKKGYNASQMLMGVQPA
mmetsp:Transcript_153512/g.286178  ORF Transcript_153512/g.286178 Transcript_153512/m.286178 type:complete len:80 (-) Transcript_153512:13-252(-)